MNGIQTRKHLSTIASLMAALGILGEGSADGVSFQGLGNLGRTSSGYADSVASAISADGSTVVGTTLTVSGDQTFQQAFIWTRVGGMRGLGVLDGYEDSEATGVSGDGSVVAGSVNMPMGNQQACTWTAGGDILGLGSLGDTSKGFVSRAYGVSEDGRVVVGEYLFNNGTHAFRWEAGTGMVDLGDLLGAGEQSSANGVSADGSVVVGYGLAWLGISSYGNLEAFRWTSEEGMVGLGDLPGGRFLSDAWDVSADGTVIVGTGSPTDGLYESEAFRWSAAEGMQGLGDLPGGLEASQAYAVSADGNVVVGYGTTASSQEAVIWDPIHGMRTISNLLASAGVDLTGWTLYAATDVSADGTVVVGVGINPVGNREGWIAVLADEEPPVITKGSASPASLWPPNHKMVTIDLDALVEDDSGEAEWGVVGIECNEPYQAGDIQIVDDHTVRLCATRSGRDDARVYTVWLQALDASCNLSERFPVEVTVPHDSRGKHDWQPVRKAPGASTGNCLAGVERATRPHRSATRRAERRRASSRGNRVQ